MHMQTAKVTIKASAEQNESRYHICLVPQCEPLRGSCRMNPCSPLLNFSILETPVNFYFIFHHIWRWHVVLCLIRWRLSQEILCAEGSFYWNANARKVFCVLCLKAEKKQWAKLIVCSYIQHVILETSVESHECLRSPLCDRKTLSHEYSLAQVVKCACGCFFNYVHFGSSGFFLN